MKDNQWSNGNFTISWKTEDKVLINDHRLDRECIMDGGDFEYALQALLSAYFAGQIKAINDSLAIIRNEKP